MLVLWSNDPPMSRMEIEKIINIKKALAPTTILSLLTRLEKKNYVSVKKRGKQICIRRWCLRKNIRKTSRTVLEKLYGNSLKQFVASLYQGKKMDKEDIRELSDFCRSWRKATNKQPETGTNEK